MYKGEKLIGLLDNLFKPINNKDYGLYWNVSTNKSKALANAEDLLKYIEKEPKKGAFINRYANLTEDLVLENSIYLDFDLTNNDYLKSEKGTTETVLEALVGTEITINEEDKPTVENDKNILKQIKKKYTENLNEDNNLIKGVGSFIDVLTKSETGTLKRLVSKKEKEELKGKSEQEIQKYYIDKFEKDYLKEPFTEATTVANYFNSIGVKTVLNWSGSKGLHLRIPITRIGFKDTGLEENPEAVKLFLGKLAELIETKILKKSYKQSSLDYNIFCKGMQRLPTSKHNKTKLYANFIEPTAKYINAIDYLEFKVPEYVPEEVDLETNTKILMESDIYKATIEQATEEATKTYTSEGVNPNYKFKGEHKKLTEVISKVYLPSVRNEVGFRIIHLLKRSNFQKGEVENIFRQLHEDEADYNETIKGSIDHAYKTEKLTGLRTLIEWLSDNASAEVKDEVIDYFKKKFSFYKPPVEFTLEEKFFYNEKEYPIILLKTARKEVYLIKDFHEKGINLEYHKKDYFIFLRKDETPIAKLRLKKTVEGVEATDKALTRFNMKIKKYNLTLDFEEILEELDLLFTDSKEINDLELSLQEEEKSPLKELEKNPRQIGALMEFSKKYLEPEAKISVAYNPNTKKNEYYIYNNEYFENLKEPILQKFIEDHYKLRLPEDSVKTLLKSIPSNNTYHNEYFQFKNNIFFNGITGEFEKKEPEFLTDKKVGMVVNGEYKLIRRLTEEELEEDTKKNGYSDLEKTVYTIMSVLDDKDESIRRYNGFLEILGYGFRPVNTIKKIINFEGFGDDGKTFLITVLLKAIPEHSVVIVPKELEKEFTEDMIGNKHFIVFDEAKTKEITKHETFLKNASNGKSNRSSRQMFTEESIDNLRFGLIIIASNEVIQFNPADEALMERDDIIHMFRRFKEKPKKEKGELKAKDVDKILDNDFRGFERIVNLAIIQYNKIRDRKNFELSTSITETQEIILGNDIIKKFLAVKTRYDKASATTNETLTTAFLNWSEKEGIDLKNHFNYKNENSLKNYIKQQLGSKIKEHYKNINEKDLVELNQNRKKQYSIRLLTNSEVTERDNTKYCINEEEHHVNQAKYLSGDDKLVYDAVHRLGEVSLNTLIKETDVPEVQLIKTLTNLNTWGYIEEI